MVRLFAGHSWTSVDVWSLCLCPRSIVWLNRSATPRANSSSCSTQLVVARLCSHRLPTKPLVAILKKDTHTYIFYLLKMTWHIKTVHKQVQSKTYKAQGTFSAASTTSRQTYSEHNSKSLSFSELKYLSVTLHADFYHDVGKFATTTNRDVNMHPNRNWALLCCWHQLWNIIQWANNFRLNDHIFRRCTWTGCQWWPLRD